MLIGELKIDVSTVIIGLCFMVVNAPEKLRHYQNKIHKNIKDYIAWCGMGVIYYQLGDYSVAQKCFDNSLAINPFYTMPLQYKAQIKLNSGQYVEGFLDYQKGHKETDFQLTGNTIEEHKTILISADNSLSDTILFSRYLLLLKQENTKVLFKIPRELYRLFLNSTLADYYIVNQKIPPYDYSAKLHFLPLFFQTTLHTVPSTVPYIKITQQIKRPLQEIINERKTDFNIGIVWEKAEIDNVIGLKEFFPIAQLPGVQVFSFHKELSFRSELNRLPNNISIVDLGKLFESYADAASAIKQMDLMICVDSPIAHLAGALNHPTFVILHLHSNWQWHTNQNVSIWYPGIRVFRKKTDNDWDKLFDQMYQALLPMIRKKDSFIHAIQKFFYPEKKRIKKQSDYCSNSSNTTSAITLAEIGNQYFKRNQFNDAIEHYQESLLMDPEQTEVKYNLGLAYLNSGQFDFAISCLYQVICDNNKHEQAYNNLGIACQKFGHGKRAIVYFEKAIRCNQQSYIYYFNAGRAYKQEKLYDKAIEHFLSAVEIYPNSYSCYFQLIDTLIEHHRYEDALQYIRHVSTHDLAIPDYHYFEGLIYSRLGRPQQVVECMRKVIDIQPEHVDAHYSLAFALLIQGMYREGFQEFEWRIARKPEEHNYGLPRWKGEFFKNKILLVYLEQGFGDAIQFIRYLPLVKQKGGDVILGCNSELYNLFSKLESVDKVIQEGDQFPECHYQVSLLSLPYLFHTDIATIPKKTPYIGCTKPNHFVLDPVISPYQKKYRIGIVWSGNPANVINLRRSVTYDIFKPLTTIDDIQVFSFQVDASSEVFEQINIVDLGIHFNDFSDTAYALKQMDLMITIETSVAHLAGAMGIPTWILLPSKADWRWLLERNDSPWYPHVRLFRKKPQQTWENLFDYILKEINLLYINNH